MSEGKWLSFVRTPYATLCFLDYYGVGNVNPIWVARRVAIFSLSCSRGAEFPNSIRLLEGMVCGFVCKSNELSRSKCLVPYRQRPFNFERLIVRLHVLGSCMFTLLYIASWM